MTRASTSGAISAHVDAEFYARVVADGRRWATGVPPTEPALRPECEAFLFAEARLLDSGRFDEWLDLFEDDCVYWIPIVPGGGDPAHEVSNAFDDRRRLEDRVVWLRNAYIWSQIPRSRTIRTIGNVEAMADPDEGDLLVRSTFVLHDVRRGDLATHFGWYAHRLRRAGDGLRIVSKQVNLADSDEPHGNMSILF